MAKLRFWCCRRCSQSCSSSSSRVQGRVRLVGMEGHSSLRMMSRASPWRTSRGGKRQARLHPAPQLEHGSTWLGTPVPLLEWGSTCLGTPHLHWNGGPPTWAPPTPPRDWESALHGRPGTCQGSHCLARRRQVNLAEPGFDLRLLDEQLLRNTPAPLERPCPPDRDPR